MTSKWIEEVYEGWVKSDSSWSEIEDTLDRINSLLVRAMYSTPDSNLYDEIRKEIKDV